MEGLRADVNDPKNYPHEDVMDLFLKIGVKKKLFTTIDSKNNDGSIEKKYKNANAIIVLAIIADYLCKPGNEDKKEDFLSKLENDEGAENEDPFYKEMGELALNILEEIGNLSQFSQSLLQANRKKLEKDDPDIRCFPVMPTETIPSRYKGSKSNRMIHEEFFDELNRLHGIQEQADDIAKSDRGHKFYKGPGNDDAIDKLKSGL